MMQLDKDIKIVPFSPAFTESMHECEVLSLGKEAWTKDGIIDTASLNGTYFVATCDGLYVGHGGFTQVLDECYITNIAVLPSYRRNGIASAILENMIAHCKGNNASFLTLEVRESNLAAINLYEKFGFLEKGRRKDFYSDPKEAAIIMTLNF